MDYLKSVDDVFGNISSTPLPWPSIANFLYEFLPMIDEYNKARQSALVPEEKWATKCCGYWLMTTFIGMAVVDVQWWDCTMWLKMLYNTRRTVVQILKLGADTDPKDCFNIITMADLIAKPLSTCKFRFQETEAGKMAEESMGDTANKNKCRCWSGKVSFDQIRQKQRI